MNEEIGKESFNSANISCRHTDFNDDSQEIDVYSCANFNSCAKQGLKRENSLINDNGKFENKKKKICTYSDNEALILAKNLNNESIFGEALSSLQMVSIWLENGECTRQNASNFYSLIQSVISHLNYMKQKKEICTEEINKIKSDLMHFTQNSLAQLHKMKTLLNLALAQKVWEHFTESQRMDIQQSAEVIDKCQETFLKVLSCGDTSRNDTNAGKGKASDIHFKQRNHQKQIENLLNEGKRLRSQISAVQEEKTRLSFQITPAKEECKRINETSECISSSNVSTFDHQKLARLIAIISPFLYTHRFNGQSTSEILSYLRNMGIHISEQEIESILIRYPSMFTECESVKEIAAEKKWTFCGCQF